MSIGLVELRTDRAIGRGLLLIAGAVVAVAILAPVVTIIFAALRSGTPGAPGAGWTLANLAEVYGSWSVVRPLVNTLLTCIPGTAIAVTLGFLLAWLVHRSDVPGGRWLEHAFLIPIYLSPLSVAVGWVVMGSPRVGLLNVLWPFGSIVNVYSIEAIILFLGLNFTPYVFLIISGALRSLDAGYEDASAILGGRPLRTLRLVIWPMLRPQILASTLLVFILSVSMFAEPALFGARFDFVNLPLAIYRAMQATPANFNLAAAYGTTMLIGALVGLVLYRWALRSSERFVTTQSRGFVARRVTLGRLRPLIAAGAYFYLVAVVVLPIIGLIYTSFMRFLGPRIALENLSLVHYARAFDNPLVVNALVNTLILSVGVATITVLFGFLVAYNVIRREIRGAPILDGIAILPIGVPPIVLSLGFLWSYLWAPIGIYGTVWALMIALSTVIIPNTIRGIDASIRQLGSDVEFAARVLGAGTARRMFQIVLPMLRGPLLSAWLFAFMLTTIQVSVPIVLRSPGQEVLSLAVWELVTGSGDMGQGCAVALIQALVAAAVVVLARRVSGRPAAG